MGRVRAKQIKTRRKLKLRWLLLKSLVCLVVIYFSVNFTWQLARKPSEILALIGWGTSRTPQQLWREYRDDFIENQTEIIPATLLAALAQVESAGNSVASPPWKWNWKGGLFDIYAPASSSFGLLQFTKGTFDEAKQYCIRNGQVLKDGPWFDFQSCWFNSLYTRLSAAHSIEMTSAYLHRKIAEWQHHRASSKLGREQTVQMAAIIHLCGAGHINRVIDPRRLGKCGSHRVSYYIEKVKKFESMFRRMN